MSVVLKPTVNNIINLWFGVYTPIRQYKIKLNPDLWQAYQRTNLAFGPKLKPRATGELQKSDKIAFAEAVLQTLEPGKLSTRKYGGPGQANCGRSKYLIFDYKGFI